MALSPQTLEHLSEAESHLRAAIRVASSSEKPLVVKQLSEEEATLMAARR